MLVIICMVAEPERGGGRLLGIAKNIRSYFLMCLQTRAMMMKVSKGMEVKLAAMVLIMKW